MTLVSLDSRMLRNRFIVPDIVLRPRRTISYVYAKYESPQIWRRTSSKDLREFVTRTSLRNDLVVVMYLAVLIEPSSITITSQQQGARYLVYRPDPRALVSTPPFVHGFFRGTAQLDPLLIDLSPSVNSPRTNDSPKIELSRWLRKYCRNFESCDCS